MLTTDQATARMRIHNHRFQSKYENKFYSRASIEMDSGSAAQPADLFLLGLEPFVVNQLVKAIDKTSTIFFVCIKWLSRLGHW